MATAGEKKREIFDILNSHNMLSASCLQKKAETSIYKNAEIGKAEMSLKNLTADFRDFTDAMKDSIIADRVFPEGFMSQP